MKFCVACKKPKPDELFWHGTRPTKQCKICRDYKVANKKKHAHRVKTGVIQVERQDKKAISIFDMMLVIYTNENHTIGEMIEHLHRDEVTIKNRITQLRVSGVWDKIHKQLMDFGGVYAMKQREFERMKKLKRGG